MKDSILYFDEIGLRDVAKVGNKNANLGEVFQELSTRGILVPDGFAISTKVYRAFLKQNNLERRITNLMEELDTVGFTNLHTVGETIRTLLSNSTFPYYTQVQILAAYNELMERTESDGHVVVRCSVIVDNRPEVNFQKQLNCHLNIKGENSLLEACKGCFISLFSDKAIKYSIHKKIDYMDVALSIGVQQMIRPHKENAPDNYTLNEEEKKTISQWSTWIEDHFQMPIKMEWARDSVDGKLYLVQVS